MRDNMKVLSTHEFLKNVPRNIGFLELYLLNITGIK